jgi:predicted nucleotidyltransferase
LLEGASKMENNDVIDLIKTYINENDIKINKMFLFGSRSQGTSGKDSDYDILLVLKDNISNTSKRKLSGNIRRCLMKNNISTGLDLIIKTPDNWEWESRSFGYLSYNVNQEGILL